MANEALLFALNRKGVCASIGGGNFQQLALLLASTGMEETAAHSAVSFTLSRYTTEDEIDRAVVIIVEAAQKLSRLSDQVMINNEFAYLDSTISLVPIQQKAQRENRKSPLRRFLYKENRKKEACA